MTAPAANGERLLSILIPTMESRLPLYSRLHEDLARQCAEPGAGTAVEVLPLSDDGTASLGAKRNQLMDAARGRFLVFVDDDDRVSPSYIQQILTAIRENPDADCISYAGEITFRGSHPHKLVHSIKYTDWRECKGEYVRPPCHITPIRSAIARRYRFAPVDYSEDMEWALRISRNGSLRREVLLDTVLYYYDSRRHHAWQRLLDNTQTARHALGLRWVNRVKLGQRIRALFKVSAS